MPARGSRRVRRGQHQRPGNGRPSPCPTHEPIRFLAEGRDVSATIDSALLDSSGFQNDGDNEITGIHVSDGDPTPHGVPGTKVPEPFRDGWRVFYTQQHGDNVVWELLRLRHDKDEHEREHER